VSVCRERGRDLRMPEPFRHGFDVDALCEQQRRHGVSSGLRRKLPRDAGSNQDAPALAPQIVRRVRLPAAIGEDEAVILPRLPRLHSRFQLRAAFRLQRLDQVIRQRQFPSASRGLRRLQIPIAVTPENDIAIDAQRLVVGVEVGPLERQQFARSEAQVKREMKETNEARIRLSASQPVKSGARRDLTSSALPSFHLI